MVFRTVSVLSACVRFACPQFLLSYDYARGDDTTPGRNPSMPKPDNSTHADGEEMDSLPMAKERPAEGQRPGVPVAHTRGQG